MKKLCIKSRCYKTLLRKDVTIFNHSIKEGWFTIIISHKHKKLSIEVILNGKVL